VAFDRDGLIYVADEQTNRITAYTIDPAEVAANGGPPTIVRRSQIVVQAGKCVSHWGRSGRGDGELNGPSGMEFDSENNLYVVDSRNNRVQKFTKDGRFLGKWGSQGAGEGELNLPWGLTLGPDGNVFVADWRNDRVQKFTPDGEFLASYGESGKEIGQFNRPTSVAVDRDGDIYVCDWLNNRVQVLAADGRFVDQFHGDSTLSKWFLEYGATPPEDQVIKRKFMSEDGYKEKFFARPISLTLDDEGRLLVADSLRFRVQVYRKEAYPSRVLMEVDMDKEPIAVA
jgi:sugar lactone lactonase YvrE